MGCLTQAPHLHILAESNQQEYYPDPLEGILSKVPP